MREFIDTRLPQLRMIEPEGTYLVWVDFRKLGLDNGALEDLILHKAGLWLDSGAIFGPVGEGFQRFNIACPRSVLAEALRRLEVEDMPLFVIIDCDGNNLYEMGRKEYLEAHKED